LKIKFKLDNDDGDDDEDDDDDDDEVLVWSIGFCSEWLFQEGREKRRRRREDQFLAYQETFFEFGFEVAERNGAGDESKNRFLLVRVAKISAAAL
jgi:hypothetical protein